MSVQNVRAALLIAFAGVLTFIVVYGLLEVESSRAAPANVSAISTPAPGPAGRPVAADSLAPRIPADAVAVALPGANADALLRSVQPGDRLNVLASLPSPTDGRPVSGVVVRGATVLQPPGPDAPLLVDVTPDDAMALAHLVLGGTTLTYAVWPAGVAPVESAPLDESTVRTRLGLTLPAAVTATAAAATPATPTPAPPTPAPETGRQYVVQPGDTLESVAQTLGVDPGALWFANKPLLEPGPLAPGMQLNVPNFRGFLYQVQPGDTWDSIGATFGLPGAFVGQLNQAPPDAPPSPGSLVFIPRSS